MRDQFFGLAVPNFRWLRATGILLDRNLAFVRLYRPELYRAASELIRWEQTPPEPTTAANTSRLNFFAATASEIMYKPADQSYTFGLEIRLELIAHALAAWHKIKPEIAKARRILNAPGFGELGLTIKLGPH